MLNRVCALIIGCVLLLTGCTSTIDAVTTQPIEPDPGKTSLGANIDDLQIETLIGVNIKKSHPNLKKAHINVTAHNAVILLTGEVATKELRTLAGDTARNFRGVRQVHNELQIMNKSSFLLRTNDSWLTTKVKGKLILDTTVDASRIKVVSDGGIIYLMGIVTRGVADKASAIASDTRGARRVVMVFEYID